MTHPNHPFRPGDRISCGKRYGTVACLLPYSVLVRWTNGKTESLSPQMLNFNYGRRGK